MPLHALAAPALNIAGALASTILCLILLAVIGVRTRRWWLRPPLSLTQRLARPRPSMTFPLLLFALDAGVLACYLWGLLPHG